MTLDILRKEGIVKTLKIRAAVLRKKGRPLEDRIPRDGRSAGRRSPGAPRRLAASAIPISTSATTGSEADEPVVLGHEGAGVVEQVGKG